MNGQIEIAELFYFAYRFGSQEAETPDVAIPPLPAVEPEAEFSEPTRETVGTA